MKLPLLTLAVAALTQAAAAQSPVGPDFRVNTTTAYYQSPTLGRAVAMAADGSFIVVWHNSIGPSPETWDIRGQRFAADGSTTGAEFVVSSQFTSSFQYPLPSVAATAAGAFVVAWSQGGPQPPRGIFARRYDSAGAPLGPSQQVHSSTPPSFPPNSFQSPTVAVNDTGRFVVAWDTIYLDGDLYGVSARLFDAAGAPLGPDFVVPTHTTGSQYQSTVDMDPAGNFVVVWRGPMPPVTRPQILGQRFDSAGGRVGTEFVLNT